MSLPAIIYFSLAVTAFIIGVHQTFVYGVVQSYWLFMATAIGLLLYRRQLLRERDQQSATPPDKKSSSPSQKRRPRRKH